MKYTRFIRIKIPIGLHARPASEIVRAIQSCLCSIRIAYQDRSVDAKSIIDLLSLGAPYASTVEVTAEGADAEEALRKIMRILSGI